MRFKITLQADKSKGEVILPINYQYELSAFIYRTIHAGNHEFGKWLHENGYITEDKKFKLFTFSRFQIPKYKQFKDRLIIISDELSFSLSFLPFKITEAFISGAFKNQAFSIGDRESRVNFIIQGIEALKEPDFKEEMQFKTLSPVVVSTNQYKDHRYGQYLKPGDDYYAEILKDNLIRKYKAFSDIDSSQYDPAMIDEFKFECTNKPRKKGVDIKVNTPQQSHIIGYQYESAVSGFPELIRTGYYAGFGEKNSLGFGCCGVI